MAENDYNSDARQVRRFQDEGFGPLPGERARPQSRPMPAVEPPRSAAAEAVPEWTAPRTGASASSMAAAGSAHTAVPDRVRIQFSRPYTAQGEDIYAIEIRKPITKEIRKFGSVLKRVFGPKGDLVDIEYNWEAVAQYASTLSTPFLPPSTVDKIEFEDLEKVADALAPFFATWMKKVGS